MHLLETNEAKIIPRPLFIFVFQQLIHVVHKILLMTGFERQTFSVGSDLSVNWATKTKNIYGSSNFVKWRNQSSRQFRSIPLRCLLLKSEWPDCAKFCQSGSTLKVFGSFVCEFAKYLAKCFENFSMQLCTFSSVQIGICWKNKIVS